MKLPKIPSNPPHQPTDMALQTLFITATLAVALHMTRLPLWISALFICFVLWRAVLLQSDKPVPGTWIRLALTIVTLAAVLIQYQTIFGRSAGSALLIAFSGLKILETRNLRDAMFSNILILIIVLSALLFDQSPFTAVYAFAALIIVVANFNTLISPQGFSWRRAVKLTGIILLNGVPLALAVYILFPRIDGSLWGIANDPYSAVTGMGDTISPGDVNRLSRSDEVVFRAMFEGDTPAKAHLYWRVKVLDHFDGRIWRKLRNPGNEMTVLESPESRLVNYSIVLEATEKTWLPLLETPKDLHKIGSIDANGVGTSRRKRHLRTEYQASSVIMGTRQAPFSNSDAATNFRIHEDVRELAARLSRNTSSAETIARRALTMFREEDFYYTLEPPLMGRDPVAQFLLEERRGYCEHYASAFAVLMRAAGIPARVVLGYQGGEWNENGEYVLVRQSDAHAWNEIWIAERGWLRIDPTAAVSPERIEYGMDVLQRLGDNFDGDLTAEQIQAALRLNWLELKVDQLWKMGDSFVFQWNRWVMAYGPEQQREFLKRLGVSAPDWGFMVFAMVIAITVFMLASYLLLTRHGRSPETPARYFRQLQKKLRLGAQPGEGPVDYTSRAARLYPAEAPDIEQIGALYTNLSYGRAPSAEGLKRLKRLVRAFKRPKNSMRGN